MSLEDLDIDRRLKRQRAAIKKIQVGMADEDTSATDAAEEAATVEKTEETSS